MYKTRPDIGQRVVFIISWNGVIARMFAGCVHFIAPRVYEYYHFTGSLFEVIYIVLYR